MLKSLLIYLNQNLTMLNNNINKSDIEYELEKTRLELSILYEISNAMRRTLKLDEILYIILTGVTSHVGLGFNRAMLLLVDEGSQFLEGKMGIGPDTGDEAGRIWRHIEAKDMKLEDLVNAYEASGKMFDSQFNRLVQSFRIPLKEDGGILAITALDDRPMHIKKQSDAFYDNEPILKKLNTQEFVTVPLRAKDSVIGVILADNIFTQREITKDDIEILTLFSNQAGLAIENSRLYEKTLIKTNIDALTGLWNHGYFQFKLNEEIKKVKEQTHPLNLIMIDIDYFKNYNDGLGHQEGDRILVEIAKVLKDSSRKSDYVCRYGGEEFAIILPQTTKQEALLLSERIRQHVQNHRFKHEEIQPEKEITVSIGLATFPEDAQTKDQLISCADTSLYEAKKTGKNKVCYYSAVKI
ncbi:MAG: sensor domain-containing diguanylate cyclase [Candidatus Omnitrophota bacterium]